MFLWAQTLRCAVYTVCDYMTFETKYIFSEMWQVYVSHKIYTYKKCKVYYF